jgi:hypothetical protein
MSILGRQSTLYRAELITAADAKYMLQQCNTQDELQQFSGHTELKSGKRAGTLI